VFNTENEIAEKELAEESESVIDSDENLKIRIDKSLPGGE
jgi:hypothetical protein